MNLQNFRIEKEPAPSTDWRVFGDIYDDAGNLTSKFGPDGTSVNVWWVQHGQVTRTLEQSKNSRLVVVF